MLFPIVKLVENMIQVSFQSLWYFRFKRRQVKAALKKAELEEKRQKKRERKEQAAAEREKKKRKLEESDDDDEAASSEGWYKNHTVWSFIRARAGYSLQKLYHGILHYTPVYHGMYHGKPQVSRS